MQDILNLNALKLLSIRNLGKRSVVEIIVKLDANNLRISDCSKENYPNLKDYLDNIIRIRNQENTGEINDLNINIKIKNNLIKAEITTISKLLSKTRYELLSTKLFGEKSIEAITNALMEQNVHLLNDEFYTCDKCGKNFVSEQSANQKHYCRICKSKLERVSQISDFTIELTGPEYSSYTMIGNGFVLYANITNETEELRTVNLTEFYLVSKGRERAPDSFLKGYLFNEEKIMPMTSKCAAKIWPLSTLNGQRLEEKDYALITLISNRKEYMYKYVFDGSNWFVDDYFEK